MDQNGMRLTSPAFADGEHIPEQYTCRGQNVNPQLNIVDIPAAAKSLALIMHDPDAVSGDFVHWLIWDIPAGTESLATNSVPIGAIQGKNGMGKNQYMGPCPPSGSGTHRYMFELYALDSNSNLSPDTSREKLQKVMKGHIIDQATLTGLVAAQS